MRINPKRTIAKSLKGCEKKWLQSDKHNCDVQWIMCSQIAHLLEPDAEIPSCSSQSAWIISPAAFSQFHSPHPQTDDLESVVAILLGCLDRFLKQCLNSSLSLWTDFSTSLIVSNRTVGSMMKDFRVRVRRLDVHKSVAAIRVRSTDSAHSTSSSHSQPFTPKHSCDFDNQLVVLFWPKNSPKTWTGLQFFRDNCQRSIGQRRRGSSIHDLKLIKEHQPN